MKNWKPWEYLHTKDFSENETKSDFANFVSGNPFPAPWVDPTQWKRDGRKDTAGVHPEDK
jgi:hypothetical protein